MLNTELLKREIKCSGFKNQHIARSMGLSIVAFSRKIKGESEFKVSEIEALSDILGLSNLQRDRIFFAQEMN